MGEDGQKDCPFPFFIPCSPPSQGPWVLGGVLSRNESIRQGRIGGWTRVECDIFQSRVSGTSWVWESAANPIPSPCS